MAKRFIALLAVVTALFCMVIYAYGEYVIQYSADDTDAPVYFYADEDASEVCIEGGQILHVNDDTISVGGKGDMSVTYTITYVVTHDD